MASQSAVDDFLSQRVLGVVGVSRSGKKFGNAVCRELQAKGYRLLPVHPQADEIDGVPCYRSLAALPEPAGGVVVVVPPREAEQVVREAAAAGIKRIWLQQGAESPAAIRFCEEAGLSVVSGQCILMFAEPVGWFHGFHRWLWRVLGKLPR
jgi:uncharacterized protein